VGKLVKNRQTLSGDIELVESIVTNIDKLSGKASDSDAYVSEFDVLCRS